MYKTSGLCGIMLRDKYLHLYMRLYGISRGITVYLISYYVYLYM